MTVRMRALSRRVFPSSNVPNKRGLSLIGFDWFYSQSRGFRKSV